MSVGGSELFVLHEVRLELGLLDWDPRHHIVTLMHDY
jgi:hypothetical protein